MTCVRIFHSAGRRFARLALLALVVAGTPAAVSPIAAQPVIEKTESGGVAGALLQDGIDAIDAGNAHLAAQLLEQVVAEFPDTAEAERAVLELQRLGVRVAAPPVRDVRENDPRAKAASVARQVSLAADAGDRVFFAANSAVLGGRARVLLENQARWLKARVNLNVIVIGRADDGGPEDAAVDLSRARAEAVRNKLVEFGVAADRITVEGRGMRDPVATCRLPGCQAQNRSAETVVGATIVPGAAEAPAAAGAVVQGLNGQSAESRATVSR